MKKTYALIYKPGIGRDPAVFRPRAAPLPPRQVAKVE
jgi:hypothetical protein